MKNTPDVLLVDDDEEVRQAYGQTLELDGLTVATFGSSGAAVKPLSPEFQGVVVTDVRMPGMDGFAFLDGVRRLDPEIPVVLVTGHGDVPMALKALRAGAWDFIEKPADPVLLVQTVRRALEHRHLVLENRLLRAQAAGRDGVDEDVWARRLIGRSEPMQRLRRTLAVLADTRTDVLIFGETGTGKEMAARALHDFGRRRAGRFVAVNCAAIPENMIESELFGHEAGAFTGARERRIGKIEHAHKGTLFLDEIESMPLAAQTRLLRALQERSIERLGSNVEIQVDIRVLAATKVDLLALSGEGRFREDLLYRLNTVTVRLPPLRDRRDDIPALFRHFVTLLAERDGVPAEPAGAATLAQMMARPWPGNVRELRNAAERHVLGLGEADEAVPAPADGLSLEAMVDIAERQAIAQVLVRHGGRVGQSAEALGISRKTLYLKMRKHGLERDAVED
ncbi:sigma-54-dependent transcriptional regulator [Ancylobacter pratisalsi]|uniref:Sigma-54-dependent Fis family transcriptional regulator n=1 Tax=Ancylobacter pratisalsi TaxID=1745854 RepID=A0A6P1YLK3_9HYPH|nr:sigma-54 dependent transcriptional regulator [Ancylobacter pratisalsi]QIB33962.1 sigma-54-dependent Fis family transcriptional regulator [Ancylobacter pratisalsi]